MPDTIVIDLSAALLLVLLTTVIAAQVGWHTSTLHPVTVPSIGQA